MLLFFISLLAYSSSLSISSLTLTTRRRRTRYLRNGRCRRQKGVRLCIPVLKDVRQSFPDICAPVMDATLDRGPLLFTHRNLHLELLVLNVQIRTRDLGRRQLDVLLANVHAHLAQRHSNVPRLQCPRLVLVHDDTHDPVPEHVGGLKRNWNIKLKPHSMTIYMTHSAELTRLALKVSETSRSLDSSALISL